MLILSQEQQEINQGGEKWEQVCVLQDNLGMVW